MDFAAQAMKTLKVNFCPASNKIPIDLFARYSVASLLLKWISNTLHAGSALSLSLPGS
jgi:hypothetical protein